MVLYKAGTLEQLAVAAAEVVTVALGRRYGLLYCFIGYTCLRNRMQYFDR